MTAALEPRKRNDSEAVEKALILGDLSALTSDERISYYRSVCKSLGLNELTRPFDYLKLNGKLQLYAKKDATEQLRKINKISIYKLEKEQEGDLYTVTAYGRTADGREDVDMGATTTKGLSGDNLVNARLKAVTKAKRRLTLSMSGLGFLDETEIETIPQAQTIRVTEQGEIVTQQPAKLHALPPPGPQASDNCEATGKEPQQNIHTEIKALIQQLAALGHSVFVAGKDRQERIIQHIKRVAYDHKWECEPQAIESANDLTPGELEDYKQVLTDELAAYKKTIGDELI